MNTVGYKVRPSSTGGWTTYLDLAGDLGEDELLTRLSAASGQPIDVCRTVGAEFVRQLIAAAREGRACPNLFGLMRSEPTSGGTAEEPDGFHTATDLNLDLRLGLLPAARATLPEGMHIEKRGQQGPKTPIVTGVWCCTTDREDRYTAGHFIRLRGRHLKHDYDDSEQGVFLTPLAGGATHRCRGTRSSTKGRIIAIVPEDMTGPLRLRVSVRIENSLRSFEYAVHLQPA